MAGVIQIHTHTTYAQIPSRWLQLRSEPAGGKRISETLRADRFS